jgi:beta-glucuronidase
MAQFGVEVPSGKPLIVSEFGAGAKFGRRADSLELWSEDYQARVYRQQLAMIENAKTLRGLSPWILKDFRTPLRFLPNIQDGWNRKGLISEMGEKKLAFQVLREAYERRRAGGSLKATTLPS